MDILHGYKKDGHKFNIVDYERSQIILDTRNDNNPPSYYRQLFNTNKGYLYEFKIASVVSLPTDVGEYVITITMSPWSDKSGGKCIQKAIALNDTLNIYYRTGYADDTGWNSWYRMAGTWDIPTKVSQLTNDKGYITQVSDTGWYNISYGNGYKTYGSEPVQVRKYGKVVHMRGVMTNVNAQTWSDTVIGWIGPDFRPNRDVKFVMQGSGSNKWLLRVCANGNITADRYSNNATMRNQTPANSWMTIDCSWLVE